VFVPHIDLLTRLELFLRRKDIAPFAVAKAAAYSRQHVLRVRLGEVGPTQRFVVDVTAACRKLSGEGVTAGVLFERGELLLDSPHQRLSRLFMDELRQLKAFLGDVAGENWPDRVLAAGIESETVIGHLLRTGERKIDQEPREANLIFLAAAGMATRLRDTEPELAASLQGHALKGRANALRHLCAFDEALAELALAARLFLKARYCTNEAGRVEYTRGGVLFKMERWSDARAAAQQARARFVNTGDTRRAAHADLLLAGILFDEGDVDAARETWLRLRAILDDLGDSEALARVWQNLGACEVRRGDAPAARHWLRYAAAAFRALENHTELARTQWNIATYVATFRNRQAGIRALQHVERTFNELGAFADAGCVGLDAIEWMIDGTPNAALTRYAQAVASVLVRAGLQVSGATALDQLRRIAKAGDKRAVVAEVRAALRGAEAPCRPAWRAGERARGAPGHVTGTA
jgi:tetratricopeptide (TPR) repeat protein